MGIAYLCNCTCIIQGDIMNKKIMIMIGIFLVIVVFGVWSLFSSSDNNCMTDPAADMNIGGHNNLAMHIHPKVSIIINGEIQNVAANIGLSSGVMRPIHTHDGSGTLHVEAPCKRDFKLHEFFEVWGRTFTYDCIYDYCNDETHVLEYKVNGRTTNIDSNFVMLDKDEIEIIYKEI